MRVAWLTLGYPWAGNEIGHIFHRQQARALAALGVDITVYAFTPWVPPGLDMVSDRWAAYRAPPAEQIDGPIRIIRPRYVTTPREQKLGFGHIGQILSAFYSKPFAAEIVHSHFAYPAGLTGVWLARQLSARSVLTLHGDDVTVYPHYNRRMGQLFRKAMTQTDHVLAVSDPLARMAEAISGRSASVISTGIDIRDFPSNLTREDARARLNLPQDAYVILYVGRLVKEKGVADFDNALRTIADPNIIGLFVGEGSVQPTSPSSRFLGPAPAEKIPDIMRAADAFVLPSWREGLGQAAVEAGAAGVPLIAAQTGGLAMLAAEGRALSFQPGDVNALISCIDQMKRDPEGARVRATALRCHVLKQHDLQQNARKVMSVYEQLLAGV